MKRASLLAAAVVLLFSPARATQPAGFEVSYAAGMKDTAGRLMAGTEMRNLVLARFVGTPRPNSRLKGSVLEIIPA